jgi:hypothetical protein
MGQKFGRRPFLLGATAGAAGLAASLSAQGVKAAAYADGSAILTVSGKVGKPNRAAFDAKRDGFFKHHNLEFTKAYAFDARALDILPRQQITATTPQIGRRKFSGHLLTDVLNAATVAADAQTFRLIALDGFAVDLPAAEAAKGWILATSADGAPFGIGDFAPLWLIRPFEGPGLPPEEEEQKWVWSVFCIEAS